MSIENYSNEEYKEYIETLSFQQVSATLKNIDKENYPDRHQILQIRYDELNKIQYSKKSDTLAENTSPKGFDHSILSNNDIISEIKELNANNGDWKKNIIGFLISLTLFAAVGLLEWQPVEIGILFIVIIIHELGHFLGMKIFGYVDPKIFFIPGFGAAASAKKTSGSPTHEAIVLLLGPIPGIAIGIILSIIYYYTENRITYNFAELFLIINLFNLLPISPLDGGRFLEIVLFRKNHIAEVIFRIITGALLLGLGIFSKSPILIIFPILFLLSLQELFNLSKAIKSINKKNGFPQELENQVPSIRKAVENHFKIHQNKKIFITRISRVLENLSEITLSGKRSAIMLIMYITLLPISIIATGTVIYLFKNPLNVSTMKINQTHKQISEQLNSKITIPKKNKQDLHINLIAVSELAKAKSILKSIESGNSFNDLAIKHSIGPNASNGGDIGFVNPNDLDKIISNTIKKLKPNGISEIIETDNSFIIVKRIN